MIIEKGVQNLCPLCGGHKVNRKYVVTNWTYYKCKNCGVVYLSQSQNTNSNDLYNLNYFNIHLGGLDTTDESIKKYYRTIGQLKYFISNHENKYVNYAEIGSGDGSLAQAAQHAGWKVKCFDVSSVAVDMLKKKGLDAVLYENVLPIEENKYDLIVMSHVIEHIENPKAILERIHLGLRAGGILFLSTPNVSSMDRIFHGPNWSGWDPPYHVVLYNERVLNKSIQAIGFEAIHIDYTFFNPIRHLLAGIKAKKLRADIRNANKKADSVPNNAQIQIIFPPNKNKINIKKIFSERNINFIFKKI